MANLCQSLRLEFPDALAAGAPAAHQSGALKGAQVFRDSLTRNLRTLRQSHDRQGAAIAQSSDDYHCLARAGDDPRSRWGEALAILTQIKSQGRLPPAKQGWIGTIEGDLAMLGQRDPVPSSTVKQPMRGGVAKNTNP
jgi:hypothetical protein